MSQLANPHEPGEVFGPYRLERRLGRGAAAEVWLAVESGDLGFSKRQALKLLRPRPGELEAQKKALINEARVCGLLGHPGIVNVYRVGEQAGELFIAMEFVDGPDLNSFLEALRQDKIEIPPGAGIDLCIELCDALDHAHGTCEDDGTPLNIIHRDLKPSNVLVDRHGLVKISDWGLVKSTLNINSTTRGIVKGTPGYIAPEVWGGTRNFQPSVDLFAVGAMLYEVVVGKRLFRGRNLARIAEQVARRQPSEEAGHASERCPELIPILEKVLQRVPDRRYQVAMDLADDLRDVRDSLAFRESFKDFVRTVRPTLERVAPRGLRTGESGRPSPRVSQPRGGVPTPSDVVDGPVPLGPSSPPVAVAEPPPEPQGPPPTRAMAPSRQVSDTTHSPRISADEARTKALHPITKEPSPKPAPPAEPSAGGSMPAPVAVQRHRAPTADTGRGALVKEKPKKKRRKAPRGGTKPRKGKRHAPVRAAAVRPPPPTFAVVVVVIGLLLLLVGLLVTFLR